MWKEIYRMEELRKEENRIHKEKKILENPMLTDRCLIPRILHLFKEYNEERNVPIREGSAHFNFIFSSIILFFFAPSSLVSYKLPNNLRNEISSVLNGWCPTSISHKRDSILFLHKTDSSIREDMDKPIEFIIKRLRDEGILSKTD